MSGVFCGFSLQGKTDIEFYARALELAIARGRNSSSLLQYNAEHKLTLFKTRKSLLSLKSKIREDSRLTIAFSGLNVKSDSQISPSISNDLFLYHDGILLNNAVSQDVFSVSTPTNTDLLIGWIEKEINTGKNLKEATEKALSNVKGTANCLLFAPKQGKLIVFSNHGSLFVYSDNKQLLIASERLWLQEYAEPAEQVKGVFEFDLGIAQENYYIEYKKAFDNQEVFTPLTNQLNILGYKKHGLQRCTRCILPETMPYIQFDKEGVCNYCHTYKKRNQQKNKDKLFELIEPYRRLEGYDCVVPFSGGRDSCFTLHLIINELKLKPVTYTYDWGMVTDVGRRNIALMCGEMGVENIVIADNIEKKRRNIALNFSAWLKNPHLGMLNILTAGDKHFFRYVNKVKNELGVQLNLWGINPLEVTHFKTGFLGIEPDFQRQRVYASGKLGQLRYQGKRLRQMIKSPGYFNRSLWDTWSGEYYRSSSQKTDFYHIFDFWQWDEKEINSLLANYGWELASDTPTTWRIGDGTAGIYNYIYYTLAGFTEHDTFRSNQIREGQLSREEALTLVEAENAPCHDNLRWYLESIGFDFADTIRRINSIPRLHEGLY